MPFLPQRPPIEIVPERPSGYSRIVWLDGEWTWTLERYHWQSGAWVVPPPHARRARWVVVRRNLDGQLFFAPGAWVDDKGNVMADPVPVVQARRADLEE